jgi:vitamin B12 transporter
MFSNITHINIIVHIIFSLLFFCRSSGYPQRSQGLTPVLCMWNADSSLVYQHINAQVGPPVGDSLSPIMMEEVLVKALRFEPRVDESPSRVSVLTREEILRSPASSIAGVVSTVPGVFIKDYGSASSLKTVAQRGLGAEHTLVLINGIRQSSSQNGLFDLGLLPTDELERVEVVHGGNSAMYGSEAVAGAINLMTRSQADPHTLGFETSLGSFGYQRYRLSGGIAGSHAGLRASVSDERSSGAFPYVFHDGVLSQHITRTNVDFASSYATLSGYTSLGGKSNMTLFGHHHESNRGVPGPVVSPTSMSLARQTNHDYLVQMSLRKEITDHISLQFSAQSHQTYERYVDPGLRIGSSAGLDTYFKNFDNRLFSAATIVASKTTMWNIGFEIARTYGSGTSLSLPVSRWLAGSFVAFYHSYLPNDGPWTKISIYPSVRMDAFSQARPSWSPQAAVVLMFRKIDFSPATYAIPRLRFSLSRNFRVPTFNELYYAGGGGRGNPDLRPEKSVGFDVSAGMSLNSPGLHMLEVTYFDNAMTDRIVWTPSGNAQVVPRNLRSVESKGLEASWSWSILEGHVTVAANYTFVQSLKTSKEHPDDRNVNTQLVYIPSQLTNSSLTWLIPLEGSLIRRVEGTITYQIVGFRYTSEDNSSFLPAFHQVNLVAVLHWGINPIEFLTKVELQNALDEDYQVILGYPMPPRSFRLSLAVTI